MEDKRSSTRTKRQKAPDEGYWDCSVCTFRNSPEAYKCEMCDVRKGTSTRKPRLNPQLVAAQVAQQFAPPATKKERSSTAHASHNGTRHNGEDSDSRESSRSSNSNRRHRWPRLKNVDRSSGTQMAVTVGNLTVIITDYKPKNTNSSSASSASSENQIHSDTSDTNSSYAGNDHDPNEDSPAEGAGN